MKKPILLSLIACVGSLLFLPTVTAQLSTPKSKSNSSIIANQNTSANVRQIAQAITVKVHVGDSRGSGVLIAKKGQTYTVLTNAHVVSRSKSYRIQTPDGKFHQAVIKNQGDSLKGNDLAVLEFQSSTNYSIAALGNSSALLEGEEVYTAGFPFDQDNLNLTAGKISVVVSKPLVGGYQIGYTNTTIQGMSGGAVLNQEGKLIGVIGMGANAILNNAYLYEDGTKPNDTTIAKLRDSSFAVPIATILKVAPQLATTLPRQKRNYVGIVGKVDNIAEQITVKIDSVKNGNGSGVIVAKQGQTYYVLTARHVVEHQDQYQVITPDDQKYSIQPNNITRLENADLAVVEFTSNQTYQVATLGNYRPVLLDWIFVSGFPANQNSLQRLLTAGKSEINGASVAKDQYSLSEGQELLNTNISYRGMSGGPILDTNGWVVGINTATEGESPTNQKGEQVEFSVGFSLGIPIKNFLRQETKTRIKAEWLKVEVNKPDFDSHREVDNLIKHQLFNLVEPAKDADAFAWLNYGNELWRLKSEDEAIRAFDKAIEIIKRQPNFDKQYYALAYYGKGLAFKFMYITDKQPEAIKAFEQAIQIDPQLYQAWRSRGDILFQQAFSKDGDSTSVLEKYSEAAKSYQQAIKINPQLFGLHTKLGYTYEKLGNYQGVIAAYTEAIKINPKSREGYSGRVNAYYKLGKYAEAIADYTTIIKIDPNDYFAYSDRGFIYAQQGKYAEAIADYTLALKINPKDKDAYLNRALIYAQQGKHPESITDLNQGIKLTGLDNLRYFSIRSSLSKLYLGMLINQNYVNADMTQGLVYANDEKYPEAIAAFTKAINNINRKADSIKAVHIKLVLALSYYYRGLLLYDNQKKYPEAIADFNQVIKIEPNFQHPYLIRGNIYTEQKKYPEAITDYNQVLKSDPNYAEAYKDRGVAYLEQGKYQEAISDFTQALKIAPEAYQSEVYPLRGNAYFQQGKYPEAISDYNQAVKNRRFDANNYFSRGVVYHKLKNYSEAIKDYSQAAAYRNNTFWQAISNIGLIKYEQGDKPAALKQWQEALIINNKAAEPLMGMAIIFYLQGEQEKGLKMAETAVRLDKNFANLEFLKQNMWGERLVTDAQKLISHPRIQAAIK